tara:strand:- start:2052 stop:3764 length:1713 start_codon:yes stop_codon:yes gene_type:complete
MARIPTPALRGQEVGSVQSQFTPTPFQNLNPDADVFGAGQARALGQASAGLDALSTGITKQAEIDRKDALSLRLLEIQKSATDAELTILTDVQQQRGRDAAGATSLARKQLDVFSKQFNTKDMRPDERAAVLAVIQSVRNSVLTKSAAHQTSEATKYKDSILVSNMAGASQAASRFWNSDTDIARQVSIASGAAEAYAESRGLKDDADGDLKTTYVKGQVGVVYKAAIDAAISQKNFIRAKELLARSQGATEKDAVLSSAEYNQLTKTIVSGSVDKAAMAAANNAVSLHADEAAALNAARNDPALAGNETAQKAAAKEVAVRFAEQRRSETARLKEQKTNAVTLAQQGKFDEIPAAVVAELGIGASVLRKISDNARAGFASISDPATYATLTKLTPEALSEVDLTTDTYVAKLNPGDWQKFVNLQAANAKPETASSQRTRTQIVTQALKAANINRDSKIKEFNEALDSRITEWEAANPNKKAPPEKIREWTDTLIIDGAVDIPRAWDPSKRVYQLEPGQGKSFYIDSVDDIPASKRRGLVAAYKANNSGAAPTDAVLVELFTKYLRKTLK